MKPGFFKTGLVAGVLTSFGLVATMTTHGDDDDAGSYAPVPPVVTVQTGVLKLMTLRRQVQGYGTIDCAPALPGQPAASAQLAASTPGIVSKVNVVEGQQVAKGDILVELNSGTTTHDLALLELGRQKKLFAQQNTSLKNVENAGATLTSLEVTSPLAGTVTRLGVSPGMSVDGSTVIVEVKDLNRLALSAEIPAATPGLAAGDPVRIASDPPVTAVVSYVSPVINPDNDTVLLRALLPAGCGLRPGQFVPVSIVTMVHTNCLAAPVASVVTDDHGKSSVARVTGTDAEKTSVQTGFRENGWVEVSAPDLKPGDSVVTVGAYGLPDQTKIVIQNSPNAASSAASAPAPQ